jgi:3-hydroxyacyl-CoA dehydrogenase/enoyl-CoA hydratase/3-hydroxybutyryl-CoA epimerase
MVTATPQRTEALSALAVEPLELGDPERAVETGGQDLAHWSWHIDEDNLAWLILDQEGTSANTLSEAVMSEFSLALEELANRKPAGLVIRSAKPSGFMVGAEIRDFIEITEEAEIATRITEGLKVLDSIERFPSPTVALLHGFCLGGGLELALACTCRIARDDARIGFPEILLGLHPGLGGTWRSLRHMDPVSALQLMLTGRTLRADAARKAGLVDAIVPERHMRAAALRAVKGQIARKSPGWKAKLMASPVARPLIAAYMERETAKKVRREHYPAPFALIDLWKAYGADPLALRMAETPSFAKLLAGDTAQELVRVFFLREKLKDLAKGSSHDIRHVHVIGAGAMGGDIAAWCAYHGFTVTLQDREIGYIAPAIKRASALFKGRYRNEARTRAALDRLIPDVAGDGVAHADLIIEAVPEDIEIKRSVYETVETRMKDDALLATNTSSILIERLSATLARPERFFGLHFFNPVARMPLVEIVTHGVLDPQVRARALAFTAAIDKLPLPARSAPGFLVNRALTPYLIEALACLDEGIPAEVIDEAAVDFGMPMGPIELADQVGLDVCLHVAKVLKRDLDHPFPAIPDWLEKKVADGDLGRKTGAGLYKYRKGKPVRKRASKKVDPALQDRLLLPLLDACISCLRQDIVEGRDLVDAGIIFGTGFAPFRGGPMHYAEERGIDEVISRLEQLMDRHGSRFKPDRGWIKFFEY